MKATTLKTTVLLGAACLLLADPVQGIDFFLRAGITTKTMPDGRVVSMWGFALDSAFGASNGVITVPGPTLVVPPNDPILRIHLDNDLPEPVSLIVNGQINTNPPAPVRNPDGRVRSFTQETPPGNGAPVTYTWPNFRPGTFLYQSATHPQVHVPMGLYGAARKDTNTLVAYPGVPYASEVILLYSEIDPALNDAVAANDFGPAKSMTSTIDFEARYFLINGQPYTNGTPPIYGGIPNSRILLRFLNAGLETRVPIVDGFHLDQVAEDGNLYPFVRRQYAVHLPPAKTLDAILNTPFSNTVAIVDRRLGMVNHTNGPGGNLAFLQVGVVPPPAPVASFTGTPTSGSVPLFVTFTDASTGLITNRLWNFGNGTTSNTTATTVLRTYNTPGTNTVTLTVLGPGGSNVQTRTAYIVATNGPPPPPPVAAFSGTPTNGGAPLMVTFTDSSTGSITNRFWSFGNGTTSNTTATTVLRNYNAAGTNTVALTVIGPGGSNTLTLTGYIVVTNLVLGAGPIVRLPFNEGSGLMAANLGSAGGVLNLTASRPTWSLNVPVTVGGASSINMGTSSGNFGVESAAPIDALRDLPAFTITGWVNNRDIAQGSGGNRIVACQDNGGQGIDLAYKGDGSLVLGIDQFPDGTIRSSSGKITTDFNAGAANWRFFAVTYDSALQQVKFYFGSNAADATLDVTKTYSRGTVGTNIGRLCIGNLNSATRGSDGSRIFRGLIDDVQIRGAVLSLPEIIAVQRTAIAP